MNQTQSVQDIVGDEYIAFLCRLNDKAKQIVATYFSIHGVQADFKDDSSPVTLADTEINSMVIAEVKKHYPEAGVHGEEEVYNDDATTLFIVDPIDGTRMFALGSPGFNFSVALVKDGVVIASLISHFFLPRTLIALKNVGSFALETGERLQVSDKTTLSNAVINTSGTKKAQNLLTNLYKKDAVVIILRSVVEASSYVALGTTEGCCFLHNGIHDIAGLYLVVTEAGGRVTELDGNEIDFSKKKTNGAVISNGLVHEELLKACAGV